MPASLTAQDGRWVQYSLAGFGTGTPMYDRGDGLVVYTHSNADTLLVFDIQSGEWLEIDLGTDQVFEDVETKGHVAFAYTDNVLIGYSALTMSWDTMSYTGDFMAGTSYYYETGENLAYFLTKSYFYVFDAELGTWQSYDYGRIISVWCSLIHIPSNLPMSFTACTLTASIKPKPAGIRAHLRWIMAMRACLMSVMTARIIFWLVTVP